MHGRSRITMDPRTPKLPGWSTLFSPVSQTSRAPSAKRHEVFGGSHEE